MPSRPAICLAGWLAAGLLLLASLQLVTAASDAHLTPASAALAKPHAPIIVNSPGDAFNPEIQTLTVTATGGTFTLTFNGQTTFPLDFNADAGLVQISLLGLESVLGVGGIVRVVQSSNIYTVTFTGVLAGLDVPEMTVDTTNLTGGTATVNTVQNGAFTDPNLTLREALAIAAPGDTIQFSPLFNTPQTITLTGGDLVINKDLSIQGPGANLLTVDANHASRVLFIPRGGPIDDFIGVPITVTLAGLTLANGDATQSPFAAFQGGAIYTNNSGTLNILDMALSDNTAGGGIGGAIGVDGFETTLNIIRSTIPTATICLAHCPMARSSPIPPIRLASIRSSNWTTWGSPGWPTMAARPRPCALWLAARLLTRLVLPAWTKCKGWSSVSPPSPRRASLP